MKELIKRILSQEAINRFYHLPKAVLAKMYYGSPTKGLKIIGVTGTDGKTTTTNMIYQILKEAGKKVSIISTIDSPGLHVTSPDPFTIQKFAKIAKKSGDEYLVLEVTSHALDQFRFWGIKFDIGVITNITHEHLDYHKTFEIYTQTKLKLIQNSKTAVVNENLKINSKKITFGLNKGDFNQKEVKLKLKIPGNYNIENALAAFSVAFVLGINKTIAVRALEKFSSLTGRMNEVKNNKGIKIFIDFAHTPNALEQALKAIRDVTKGKIIAVFGSAGKRDTGKRAIMGQIAAKLANVSVVTAEDPRGELDVINKQISEGAIEAGAKKDVNLFVIPDREKAIEFAIDNAKNGDSVGIFGKGHESSMNLDGKSEIPWSDFMAVKRVLDGQ